MAFIHNFIHNFGVFGSIRPSNKSLQGKKIDPQIMRVFVVPSPRIELGTHRFSVYCSTN